MCSGGHKHYLFFDSPHRAHGSNNFIIYIAQLSSIDEEQLANDFNRFNQYWFMHKTLFIMKWIMNYIKRNTTLKIIFNNAQLSTFINLFSLNYLTKTNINLYCALSSTKNIHCIFLVFKVNVWYKIKFFRANFTYLP